VNSFVLFCFWFLLRMDNSVWQMKTKNAYVYQSRLNKQSKEKKCKVREKKKCSAYFKWEKKKNRCLYHYHYPDHECQRFFFVFLFFFFLFSPPRFSFSFSLNALWHCCRDRLIVMVVVCGEFETKERKAKTTQTTM